MCGAHTGEVPPLWISWLDSNPLPVEGITGVPRVGSSPDAYLILHILAFFRAVYLAHFLCNFLTFFLAITLTTLSGTLSGINSALYGRDVF